MCHHILNITTPLYTAYHYTTTYCMSLHHHILHITTPPHTTHHYTTPHCRSLDQHILHIITPPHTTHHYTTICSTSLHTQPSPPSRSSLLTNGVARLRSNQPPTHALPKMVVSFTNKVTFLGYGPVYSQG